jgi:hypothetical protein
LEHSSDFALAKRFCSNNPDIDVGQWRGLEMARKATRNEIFSAEHLLADVFNNANVGLAILDDQLR